MSIGMRVRKSDTLHLGSWFLGWFLGSGFLAFLLGSWTKMKSVCNGSMIYGTYPCNRNLTWDVGFPSWASGAWELQELQELWLGLGLRFGLGLGLGLSCLMGFLAPLIPYFPNTFFELLKKIPMLNKNVLIKISIRRLVCSCFRGQAPPLLCRAVCLVRAIPKCIRGKNFAILIVNWFNFS